MLNKNIKTLRKQKGLTQEELSVKLNVVRQTVSKWESGLSIPDAEMLVSLSNALDVPGNTLLDQDVSKKLNAINLPVNQQKDNKRKFLFWVLVALCIILIITFIGIMMLGNTYMEWNYENIETALLGFSVHSFIWIYIRVASIIFICCLIGIFYLKR